MKIISDAEYTRLVNDVNLYKGKYVVLEQKYLRLKSQNEKILSMLCDPVGDNTKLDFPNTNA